ncbi:MAG: HAD-IA family hydrolase [Actinobacteria bacterium]|nr:HAD-IA family hydrolase [Actinomycetota bacterium]
MAGAVLFDFHDTLAHLQASTTAITARAIGVSEAETRSAWLRVEARIRELQHGPGWPPPSEQRWQIIYSWMFEFLGIDGDPQRPLDLLDGFFQNPDNYGLFEDAAVILHRFRGAGYRIGIVSNSDFDLWPMLNRLGIADLVDIALPTIALGIEKPHPEAYLAACRALQADPLETWFVGDNIELDGFGPLEAGLMPIIIDREQLHANVEVEFPVVRDLGGVWSIVANNTPPPPP